MNLPAGPESFHRAGERIRVRLAWIALAEWIRKTHVIAGISALAAVFVLRRPLGWDHGEWLVIGAILLIWLGWGLLIAIVRTPDPLGALAIFDRRSSAGDRFSSAFAFLGDAKPLSPGQQLHVSRTSEELPRALKTLPAILPRPGLSPCWILPALAMALAFAPLGRKAPGPGDSPLAAEMIAAATDEAGELRKAAQRLEGLEALSESERAELERLEQSIAAAADELSQSEGQTAGEVLDSLEQRARAAERLAEKLASASSAWASRELIGELSRHADTADLAVGVRDRDARIVAEEADALAGILGGADLIEETRERITLALERAMARATDEDQGKPVGAELGQAAEHLASREPIAASEHFRELADHFRRTEQRDEARERIESIAARLRESGSRIGGSRLESLETIGEPPSAPGPAGELKSVDATPLALRLQDLTAPRIPQPDAPGPESLPVPGTPDAETGPASGAGRREQALSAPVPGQTANDADGGGLSMQFSATDTSEPGAANDLLSAPIPGAAGAPPPPGATLGGNDAGSTTGGNSPGLGGQNAGSTTASITEEKSSVSAASRESSVVARISGEGESEWRSVEGTAPGGELAKRAPRDILRDFIEVEEAALDEKTLPLTRRDQVRRYFSAIRRQLEAVESEP